MVAGTIVISTLIRGWPLLEELCLNEQSECMQKRNRKKNFWKENEINAKLNIS